MHKRVKLRIIMFRLLAVLAMLSQMKYILYLDILLYEWNAQCTNSTMCSLLKAIQV